MNMLPLLISFVWGFKRKLPNFDPGVENEFSHLPYRVHQRRDSWNITQMYLQPLAIKDSKFQYLQQLKTVMPPLYHAFYNNLPHYIMQ